MKLQKHPFAIFSTMILMSFAFTCLLMNSAQARYGLDPCIGGLNAGLIDQVLCSAKQSNEAKQRQQLYLQQQRQLEQVRQAQMLEQQQLQAALERKNRAVHDCDALAGHPNDYDFMREVINKNRSHHYAPVSDESMDATAAYEACKAALNYPEIGANSRYHFQMGRSLWRLGRYETAITAFTRAANDHSVPAHHYLGVAYDKGYAVSIDQDLAKKHYLIAARNEFPPSQEALKEKNITYKTIRQEEAEATRLAQQKEAKRVAAANQAEAEKQARLKAEEAKRKLYLSKNPNREPTAQEMAKAITAAAVWQYDEARRREKNSNRYTNSPFPYLDGWTKISADLSEATGGRNMVLKDNLVRSVKKVQPCVQLKARDGYICKIIITKADPVDSTQDSFSNTVVYGNFIWINGSGWMHYKYEPSMADGYY